MTIFYIIDEFLQQGYLW